MLLPLLLLPAAAWQQVGGKRVEMAAHDACALVSSWARAQPQSAWQAACPPLLALVASTVGQQVNPKAPLASVQLGWLLPRESVAAVPVGQLLSLAELRLVATACFAQLRQQLAPL